MSGQSSTSIANRALQGLGAASILALTDNSREARAANQCYDTCRRAELRANRWKFARKRAILAADAAEPLFGFKYAFPLPADFMFLPLPNDYDLDWQVEGREILTNSTSSPWSADLPAGDGPALGLVYFADIEDATLFDPMFCEVLSARMQMAMCEQITQSNAKLQAAQAWYTRALAAAAGQNALERLPAEPPEDGWLVAHRS